MNWKQGKAVSLSGDERRKGVAIPGRAGNDWNLYPELANGVIVIGQENAGEKDGGG